MATNTDTHISRVILDTKEAKDKLKELQKSWKTSKRQRKKPTLKVNQQQPLKDKSRG